MLFHLFQVLLRVYVAPAVKAAWPVPGSGKSAVHMCIIQSFIGCFMEPFKNMSPTFQVGFLVPVSEKLPSEGFIRHIYS